MRSNIQMGQQDSGMEKPIDTCVMFFGEIRLYITCISMLGTKKFFPATGASYLTIRGPGVDQ